MLKNKRGQSTIEYIILVTAVIVVVLVFLMTPNSMFSKALNDTLNETSAGITEMSGRLSSSRPGNATP